MDHSIHEFMRFVSGFYAGSEAKACSLPRSRHAAATTVCKSVCLVLPGLCRAAGLPGLPGPWILKYILCTGNLPTSNSTLYKGIATLGNNLPCHLPCLPYLPCRCTLPKHLGR